PRAECRKFTPTTTTWVDQAWATLTGMITTTLPTRGHNMYRHMIIAALLLFVMGCSQRETPKPPSAQPQEAAANALTVLQKLVTDQNYRALGFESADEVKEAQLGQPLAVYYVGLEKLKAYREGTDVNSLLAPYAETIYPVTVRGNVRSSVTIVHKDAGYEPASFGNADVVK